MIQHIPTRLGRIAVSSHGPSDAQDPPVLLWHSLFLDHRSWDSLLPPPPPSRRLLVIDGPGHGASPGPGRDFTLDECATAAEELCDQLRVDAVDWIGNAWGGHVGVVLAARGSTRLRSLAVVASPMQPLAPRDRAKVVPLVALFRLVGARGFLVRAVTDALVLPSASPAIKDHISAALQRPPRAALYRAMRSVMLARPSLVERLSSITIPTVFVATRDDPTWPLELARAHAARLANGRFVEVSGSRHLPPLEIPETLGPLLADWLEENLSPAPPAPR